MLPWRAEHTCHPAQRWGAASPLPATHTRSDGNQLGHAPGLSPSSGSSPSPAGQAAQPQTDPSTLPQPAGTAPQPCPNTRATFPPPSPCLGSASPAAPPTPELPCPCHSRQGVPHVTKGQGRPWPQNAGPSGSWAVGQPCHGCPCSRGGCSAACSCGSSLRSARKLNQTNSAPLSSLLRPSPQTALSALRDTDQTKPPHTPGRSFPPLCRIIVHNLQDR